LIVSPYRAHIRAAHAQPLIPLVLSCLRLLVVQLVVAVKMVVFFLMDGFYVVWSDADATAMTPNGLL
jgi:hypothetical protein